MIPCSKDCLHQTDGYCVLAGDAKVTSTTEGCAYFEGRKKLKNSPSNKLDRFAYSSNVDKLNCVGNLDTH